ncbi:MAG: hypothetical protein SGILL_008549 [Bacillariaceae sp.]
MNDISCAQCIPLNSYKKSESAFNMDRNTAKRFATGKMYTPSGEPIRNLEAYRASGGTACNARGDVIENPTAYRNAIEASVRQNTNDPKYQYHYTDNEAAKSIRESGAIRASSNGLGGSGTYLTPKPPRCNGNAILSNNYDGATRVNDNRVQSYVRMDADGLNAQRVPNAGGRNVWKADGNVHFEEHNGFVGSRQNQSGPSTHYYAHSNDVYDDYDEDEGDSYYVL